MMHYCGYILAMVLAQTAPAANDSVASIEQRFAEAQARFEAAQAELSRDGGDSLEARRMFREAATQFAALAAEGTASANLYVNAGNAFHFAGDEPRALLWYLRADQLARTPEIRAGLATLRRVCGAELWPPPRGSIGRVLMFWHFDLSGRLKQMLLLGLYPIGCALIVLWLFTGRRRGWLPRVGIALMLLGGVMGISDVVAQSAGGEQWAVVLEPTKGLAGDGQMYSTIVERVVPGQEVRILESRREWLHVELPSGTRCWLPGETCEAVQPIPQSMGLASDRRSQA
jgi:hypothetical protein